MVLSAYGWLSPLPTSTPGLGVRDTSFIAVLVSVGITTEMAVSYSLLILLTLNVVGAAWEAAAWFTKPLE